MTNIAFRCYYEYDCFGMVMDIQIQEIGDNFDEEALLHPPSQIGQSARANKTPSSNEKFAARNRETAQGKSMIFEEDLEKMCYLQAVLKETLRLHTPLPLLIFRKSTQNVKLMGYDIAAGTQGIINVWVNG